MKILAGGEKFNGAALYGPYGREIRKDQHKWVGCYALHPRKRYEHPSNRESMKTVPFVLAVPAWQVAALSGLLLWLLLATTGSSAPRHPLVLDGGRYRDFMSQVDAA